MRPVAAAFFAGALSANLASAQVPAGGEFRVNTTTSQARTQPAVAWGSGGGFVVAWHGTDPGGQYLDVMARVFDASGTAFGPEFQVNTFSFLSQLYPSVASDAAGNYILVWQSAYQDGYGDGIFARRFDASGGALGQEFRVNAYTTGQQYRPSVASDAAGNFVVTWIGAGEGSNSAVFGQRFDPAGTPRGSPFEIALRPEYKVAVASAASGDFVVVWQSYLGDGSGSSVRGRRYHASGSPVGDSFQVNTYTTHDQAWPTVAADASGNFVVTWLTWDRWLPDLPSEAWGRRYDASGTAVGLEFRIGSDTAFQTGRAVAAFDGAGGLVVTWHSFGGQDGNGAGVFAQRYDASGARRGTEFRVNSYTTSDQWGPAVASDAAGKLIVSWTSNDQSGEFPSVYARRLGGLLPAALALDGSASSGSDGNGVLEPGETAVTVAPSWRNLNSAAQAFGGIALSFAGPPASGVSYALTDAAGDYGLVPSDTTFACSDCYQVGLGFGGTRPALHWDATFSERLTPEALGQATSWSVHVGESFGDVPKTSPYYRFVETLLHKAVTGGCAATSYCPADPVSREQAAVFVLVGKEGAGYSPPPCTTPVFGDVPSSSGYCRFVEELARRRVVSGCGGGNYCPASPVTREQMPVFMLRLLDPPVDPPACGTPMFADVPASSPYCRFIEDLARRGVVSGCGGGNYCPADPVTREQMAVFISVTFALTLYGP